MKTSHTIYTSFAKRLAIILTLLLTIGVTSAWGAEYEEMLVLDVAKNAPTGSTTTAMDADAILSYLENASETKNEIKSVTDVSGKVYKGKGTGGDGIPQACLKIGKASDAAGFTFTIADTFDDVSKVTIIGYGWKTSTAVSVNESAGQKPTSAATEVSFDYILASPTKTIKIYVGSSAFCATQIILYKEAAPKCAYTVTFNSNYGTNATSSQEFTCGETKALAANSFSRTGYTFARWNTEANGSGDSYSNQQSVSNLAANGEPITLYAQWTPTQYTITYTSLEGATHSNPTKYTIESETITFTDPSERVGYKFTGWNPASITKGSTGNKTVTAQWKAKDLTNYRTTCTTETSVSFNLNGGSGTFETVTLDGDSYTIPETVPTRDGYNFVGWKIQGGDETIYKYGTSNSSISNITESITLVAQWSAIEYTITYYLNGGSGVENTTYTIESGNITLPTPTPAQQGLIFAGWYESADFTGNAVTVITHGSTGNKEFWAKWEKSTPTFAWSADSYTAALEADNTFPTLSNPDVLSPVTYTSSNTGVATIDEDGNITLVATGTATIIATGAETATHKSATANYTLNVAAANCKWVEANTIEDGDEVVIAMKGTNGVTYTFENTKNTTSAPSVVEVNNISGTYITNVVDRYKWVVNKDGDDLTFKSYSSNDYLYCINKNGDGVRVGNTSSSRIFIIDNESGYLKHKETSRYLGVYSYQDWRCYANKDNFAGQTLKFYKKECLDSETFWVDYNLANVTCTTAPPHSQIAKSETLALNFEAATGYALPDNVTVTGATPSWDKATGTLTISNPTDNVTITIEAIKLHTITWMVGGSELTTGSQTTSVENGKKITAIPANPNDNTLEDCGATKFMGWSTDNIGSTPDADAPTDLFTTVAEAQSKIGGITENKTFYAVFATAEETDGGTVDATLSFASTAQRTSLTNDKAVWQQNNITLTNTKGTEQNAANCTTYVNPVRFYKYSKIKVEHTSDEISKILFTCNTSAYATVLNTSIGTYNNVTVEVNDKEVVVTFNSPVEAFEVKLTDQVRMDALTITAGGGTITTYSNYVTNCCATPVPTNGSYTSPSETSVALTWDGESTRYHITGNGLDDYTDDESYTVTGLTECNEYTFYVSAYPEDGCESEAIAITAQPFSGAKTVTFNYNGNGQANTTSSTSCGNTSITLPTPVWTGYRFMGWFNAASGGTKVGEAGASYKPTDDITLHAHWEKEYTVTYDANGGSTTCANGNYIEGETVTICTTNPSKTGYTFAGWTYSPSVTITDGRFVMPASDVTITAQWQVNSYTVTWNPNGGNWGGNTENIVETYEYGATIVQPAAPQRDGYRFTGWSPAVSSTMPAGDKTYTAQWKQNYTITFYDGDDVTPWTQTKDAESINLTEYLGTLACDDYQFAGWSTDATKYDDEPANITTWVTGTYTPTANIHLYAVYVKGDLATDFTLNCDGGVYEIWEKGHNQHMAGRQNGGGDMFYTTEWYNGDCTSCEGTDGAPFTITKVADNTYTLQNADGQYITRDSYDGNADELEIKDTWENADRYKWIISEGTNGSWRFTNKAATTYALVFYDKYFQLRIATNVTNGSSYYDLELTPAQTNVYQSNPNCGTYTITFETGGGEFVQGNYKYSTAVTSNLTETTTTRFPAAELEGYTFAGWKDGAPQDDVNYEPYLKKADDNLVVSSNKTYYAVYYYYDEEEDIDWSKEFTTAIYADVNGIKYFLAGTPNGGTMSSTTDCGYVSEVTITPGTGANAGKYKITVNDVGMAPKAGETDLVDGTAWWTITETSVGSGEYKISGEDKRNIVLRNSSYGHYAYNAQGSYNGNYYYPRFGKCLEHHWTSNPTPKPSIKLSGDVYVTATNGCGIMATQPLSVIANNLHAGETLTLTSNSNDVCFSKDRTVNFVKASKPTASLTLTADATGKIDKEVYVHYKPSTEGDGVPADVVVTATASSVSKNHTIHVRNLPTKFVIATKVGATWYALPANMSEATNPLGVVIEVDETTMTTIAPNTTTYTLWSVKTTATEYDRYTNVTGAAYGDRVRFAAVNYEQRGLWANNNNNSSAIRNYAVINSLGADATAAYEWKVTTTVVDGHWQYTLQTDQDKNQNFLRYWTAASGGAKWGTYASGNEQLYFLPVTTYTDLDLEVMEWGTNSMVIRAGEDLPQNVNITINGTTTPKTLQNINGSDLYKIDDVTLTNDDCGTIIIDNGLNARKIIRKPLLVSGNKSGSEYTTSPGRDICAECDIVILNGGKLIADEAKSTGSHVDFANIYVYPGGKLMLAGNSLGVKRQVYLRGGYSWINQTTYDLPEVYVNGDINFNGSGNIIYDYYIQNYKYYQFSLPYQVPLAEVTDEAGVDNFPVWVKHYNGALRAADANATSWEWYYGDNFEAGIGYIIAAKPRQEGKVANRPLSIIRFPLGNSVISSAEADKSIATTAHGIVAYNAGTITANNVGWNFIGNPFMATWKGDIGHQQLMKSPDAEHWNGSYHWENNDVKYITVMSPEDGTDYDQYIAANTELKPFFPFYLQETADGGAGTINFAAANRIQKAPAELYADEPREAFVQVEILTDRVEDQAGVFISDTYSDDIDFDDYEKIFGSSLEKSKLWFIHEDKRMAFEAMTEASAAANIALGYRAPRLGKYTFAINEDVSALNEVVGVYLTDHELGVMDYNLLYNTYEFETKATTYNDQRFTIRIALSDDSNGVVTGVDNIGTMNDGIYKFIYQDKMYIYNDGIIYDATGKQVTNINK